jgi:hypothetical protein
MADCKNLRIMEKIDWLNAVGIIICRKDNDVSKVLAKEIEKTLEEHFQKSVSGR